MKLLLKSATIIDASSKYHQKKVDILINNGIIEKIGSSLKSEKVDEEISLKRSSYF